MREGRKPAGRGARVLGHTLRVWCPAGGAIAAALLAGGCGGTRVDAHEPSATYDMQVLAASFPAKQSIARPETMTLLVRNSGNETVPNVAVTVDSFEYLSGYPGLAARKRPIWAIEQGPGANAKPSVESQEASQPGNGQTAYINTWALGPLAAGDSRRFSWRVVPVTSGRHFVHWSVAAGLAGKSRARGSNGPLSGQFSVQIAAAPATSHVNPSNGKVEPGSAPPVSAP